MPSINTQSISDLIHPPVEEVLSRVGKTAMDSGVEVYAVGGVVRDTLLDRSTTDIDFVTIGHGTGIQLAEAVCSDMNGTTAHVYPNFGTASVHIPSPDGKGIASLEFVGARKESYRRDSRKPIVEEGSLDDDLNRRDFTVNAIAMHISPDRFGEIIDPFGGKSDLEKGVLRTPLDPAQTFDDDPLRIIRAARFSAQLGFLIEPNTYSAMRECADRLSIVSMERISNELEKIISAPVPSIGFRALFESGALELFFPELVALHGVDTIGGQKHKDNFFHTLEVLDNLIQLTAHLASEETHWLRWAALLHDIGKPKTKRFTPGSGWTFHSHEERGARMVPKIFKRLRLPSDERMKYVQKLIRLHHRPVSLVDETVTDSAVRRLLFDAGDEVEDLMILVRADITSKNARRVRKYLHAFDSVDAKMIAVEETDRIRNFQPPVDGLEIMKTLGLEPGRIVGDLKEAIREAILEGIIPNEHDAAFAYLMEIKDRVMNKTGDLDRVRKESN
ncbi:MAG: HD domain-containing protein [Bacteroidetes bacterium]|nr:MAG: HD domain-containing protein [Bacteroidota bacterium]